VRVIVIEPHVGEDAVSTDLAGFLDNGAQRHKIAAGTCRLCDQAG
jgi:hypothetical protein